MYKPENYDTSNARTLDFDRPDPGAYVMTIYAAHQTESQKAHRPMLVLLMDISEGRHVGYFNKLFNIIKAKNQFAKWPCIHRRCMDGDQTPYLKGDITSIEKSNNVVFKWDLNQLIGLKVGCVLGEKEIDENGKTILEPQFLCSVQSVTSGKIRSPKRIPFQSQHIYAGPVDDSMYPPQGNPESDLPF